MVWVFLLYKLLWCVRALESTKLFYMVMIPVSDAQLMFSTT